MGRVRLTTSPARSPPGSTPGALRASRSRVGPAPVAPHRGRKDPIAGRRRAPRRIPAPPVPGRGAWLLLPGRNVRLTFRAGKPDRHPRRSAGDSPSPAPPSIPVSPLPAPAPRDEAPRVRHPEKGGLPMPPWAPRTRGTPLARAPPRAARAPRLRPRSTDRPSPSRAGAQSAAGQSPARRPDAEPRARRLHVPAAPSQRPVRGAHAPRRAPPDRAESHKDESHEDERMTP
jgi:hypothetical protein